MSDQPSQPELTRGKKLLFRITGIFLVLLFTMILFEGGSRILVTQMLNQFAEGVANDPANLFNILQSDPDLGWSHVPGKQIEVVGEGGTAYTVKINQAGLNDLEYTYQRPADGFRVLVLGDSFIEAVQVPPEERSFQQLEDCYNTQVSTPYEIIEAGVTRYSPIQYALYYQHEGYRYQSDVVIVALYLGNDLGEMHPASPYGYLPGVDASRNFYMLDTAGNLVLTDDTGWKPSERRISARERLHFFLQQYSTFYRYVWPMVAGESANLAAEGAIIPQAQLFQTGYEFPDYTDTWPILEALLLDLREQAEADGSEFAVVITVSMFSIYPDWYFETFPEAVQHKDLFDPHMLENQMIAMLEKHEITYFSLTPALEAAAPTADPLYSIDDVHWTAAGHDVVTAALAGWFAEQGWGTPVDCPVMQPAGEGR